MFRLRIPSSSNSIASNDDTIKVEIDKVNNNFKMMMQIILIKKMKMIRRVKIKNNLIY